MKREDILAVVVSYNGGSKIRRTVDALREQVGHVLIVDNGSAAESLRVLDQLDGEDGVAVVRLGENRGVGHALNLGVRRARQLGCRWLLTMDQDSLVDGSMIQAYQAAIARDPALVCLAPLIAASDGRKNEVTGGVARYAITSGNMVRVALFDEVGLYDEGFFIDCIDFDFCLRLRRAGHSVHRIPGALMQHQLGEATRVPSRFRRYYALHAPVRRYYMIRNYLYLVERYLFRFPGFIIRLGISHLLLSLLVGLFDPHPLESYGAMARGIRDYLARRVGPHGESAR